MCLAQRHLKRLLAFSTISHMGMLLIAVGLLDPLALAGAAVYTVAHGLVKGSLFLLAGILLHCLGTVDEHELGSRPAGIPTRDRIRRRRGRAGGHSPVRHGCGSR